mmetsp:Transcript_22907/g.40392  ORF Transcript_22907/g.40392 Transcript_22907/m.40392 type:complete len:270 (+) Transcript_22907:926-1735(+)
MQLAHAFDDGLVGLLVAAEAERRVLGCKLCQRFAQLVCILLGVRFTRDLDHRLWELHLLKDNGRVNGAQGVPGGGVLQAHDGDDVTSLRLFDLLTLVGVHQHHAAHALLGLAPRVPHHLTGLHLAGVDPVEGQCSNVGIRRHLEGQTSQLLVRFIQPFQFLIFLLGIFPLGRGQVLRRGQVRANGIQQRLNALVLESSAAQHRDHAESKGALSDAFLEVLCGRRLATLQVGLQNLLIIFHSLLDQVFTPFLDVLLHSFRDVICDIELGT